VDAKLDDEADLYRMIRVDDILGYLQQAKTLKILVLDSCRNNPLAETLKRSIGLTRAALIQRGLTRIEAPLGTIISFSTQAGQEAIDGEGRNSPYTAAFLKHIEQPSEIGEVFRDISADVYRASNSTQLPELSLSVIGKFYLNGSISVDANSPARPPTVDRCAAAETHWKAADAIATIAAYEDHLANFTGCAFAELARSKIETMRRQANLAAPERTGNNPAGAAQSQPIKPSTPTAEPAVGTPAAHVVDPGAVGTWETMIPSKQGMARWTWDILPGGTYRFRNEGPGPVKRHEGTIAVSNGRWTLHSTRGLAGWRDGGSYEFRDVNTLVMTGRLGTGIWRRIDAPAAGGATQRGPTGASRSVR